MVTKPTRPGLQPERTSIAWLRTSLALIANALLIMRWGLHQGRHGWLLLVLSMAICLGYVFVHLVREHKRRRHAGQPFVLPRIETLTISLLTITASVVVAFS